MLAKQNKYTIDMVVYAATLKAHYAYYVQTWNKSGKREYSIEPSLYAVKSFIESKGINADHAISDFILSLETKHSMKKKLEYFHSFNTYCGMNERCIARHAAGETICKKCYSFTLTAIYDALLNKLIKASFLFCNEIIESQDMPVLNHGIDFERLESFGDINNRIQAINYINLCVKNDHMRFTLWSKNPDIMYAAFLEKGFKPKNMVLIYSSPKINKIDKSVIGKYIINGKDIIDRIFTVYTAEYAILNNIQIHCINSHCISCMRCYKGNAFYVNEIVKIQQKYYLDLKAAKNAGSDEFKKVFKNHERLV